jgi:hypothetical protein
MDTRSVRLGEIGDGDFVIRSNVPLMLLGKFDDMVQTTVLRSPFDIIPSIITKTVGGIGGVVSAGVALPPETNKIISIEHHIDSQYYVYEAWCYGIMKNIDNLLPFTFEQVTQDIEYVLKSIFNKFDIDHKNISNNDLDRLIGVAKNKIRQHDKGHPGYNNAVPVIKKPDAYYEIQEELKKFRKNKELNEMYNECKLLIEKKQNG